MHRDAFLAQPDVSQFIDWLIQTLPTRQFHLRMKRSRYVPAGLNVVATGLQSVLSHYIWHTSWTDGEGHAVPSSDWTSTRLSLHQLSGWLRRAVSDDNEDETLAACLAILDWGGVWSATPFLKRLHDQKKLAGYLRDMAPLMSLTAQYSLDQLNAETVLRFDAGLTKIHALLDDTGSPIYDSRVGAAIAMLYGLYRKQAAEKARTRLKFPSSGARGTQIRNPHAIDSRFGPAPQFYTSSVSPDYWARCQVSLGWIARAVLERCDWFDDKADMATRCHAFEASLFMIGYDLRSFGMAENQPQDTPDAPNASPADDEQLTERKLTGWVPTSGVFDTTIRQLALYRQQGGEDDQASFCQWLVERGYRLSTANAYCYPFKENEFDLFGRSVEEIIVVAAGGKAGLYAALGRKAAYIEGAERERVCLVDVLIKGRLQSLPEGARRQRLLTLRYAGTLGSAGVILSMGSKVGRHFGLLDGNDNPTDFFDEFFGNNMADIATCGLDAEAA